jgi:hypothetical protein
MSIKGFRGSAVGVLALLSVAAVLAGCGGSDASGGSASEAGASASPSVDASASPSVTGSSPAAVVANSAVVSGSNSAATPIGTASTPASGSSDSSSSATTSSSQSVTLSWSAPTENTNGTALTNLAGYVIYYGTSATAMTQQINVNTVGMLVYQIPDLAPGTWYFQIMSVNSAGVQSSASATVTMSV